MQSYFECIEQLDAVAGEIHLDHGEPDHAIPAAGLDLDYGMTTGRLVYRPDPKPRATIEPAFEFTAGNIANRAFHRYSLSRESDLVIVQFSNSLRKNETRKPRERDGVESSSELGRIARTMPYKVLTVTGLRRLASDMEKFKSSLGVVSTSTSESHTLRQR